MAGDWGVRPRLSTGASSLLGMPLQMGVGPSVELAQSGPTANFVFVYLHTTCIPSGGQHGNRRSKELEFTGATLTNTTR